MDKDNIDADNLEASRSATENRVERRRADRARNEENWESKVLGRVSGRLKNLSAGETSDQSTIGWESAVLDLLRRRIERGPQ